MYTYYWPISVLSLEYKTYQKTLDTIIGENQPEAIKNRILLQALSNIFRVHWDFNFSVFHKFRYGDKFIRMVEDAYSDIQSKIKIIGLLSDPFTFIWGVYQGCLFSMLLYFTAAEVLASFINANKRIKGIQIGHHEIKIVSFADNITIFLKDVSSSKINFSKSQALSMGWCI